MYDAKSMYVVQLIVDIYSPNISSHALYAKKSLTHARSVHIQPPSAPCASFFSFISSYRSTSRLFSRRTLTVRFTITCTSVWKTATFFMASRSRTSTPFRRSRTSSYIWRTSGSLISLRMPSSRSATLPLSTSATIDCRVSAAIISALSMSSPTWT